MQDCALIHSGIRYWVYQMAPNINAGTPASVLPGQPQTLAGPDVNPGLDER